VTTRTGEPAAGAFMVMEGRHPADPVRPQLSGRSWRSGARCDAAGVARFEGLGAGEATLRVEDPGFVCGGAERLMLREGETISVRVEEALGRGVVVRAVDGSGRGVPGVVISIDECRWDYAPVDGAGVQHFDIVTDPGGNAFLPRVPPGPIRIRGRRGDVRGRVEVPAGAARVELPF
jgi:hypothetical protein